MNENMNPTLVENIEINLSSLPKIGEIINAKYKIIREIARGGMGVVYEALNIISNQKLALKMLRIQDADSIVLHRFEREIQACNELSHPNIIKIHDWGLYKKNPYMVMDYITGIPITQYIKNNDPAYGTSKKRNYDLCVKLMAQVAHALEYVHQHKIYHRDLKPSNILICEDGTPILIDFGIVKFENQSQTLTKTSEIIGTCNYMSPEQIKGKHSKLDQRSDVYSLGVILYELITEKSAFSGDLMKVLTKIATVYPILPTSINSNIPKELESIIMTSIEKDRKYRFQTAQEFAEALEEYLENSSKQKESKHQKKSHYKRHSKNEKNLLVPILTVSICILVILIVIVGIGKFNKQSVEHKVQTKQEKIEQLSNGQDKKEELNTEQDTNAQFKSKQTQKIQEKQQPNLAKQLQLAYYYYNQQNFDEAFKLFSELARQGNADAQFTLGTMYVEGKATSPSESKAVIWYEKAAIQGHIKAQHNLGCTYIYGHEIKHDITKAIYWFEKAAKQGFVKAQFQLGYIYLNYGNKLPISKDIAKAIYWFEKLANQGDAEAQFHLGVIYFNDYPPEFPQNLGKAIYWFEKAANKGQVQAQYHLGQIYLNGQGVKQDIDKAIYWFEKGAKQGELISISILGQIYLNGQGVKQNIDKAIYWFEKGAKQGNAEIQNILGTIYADRKYGKSDFKKAYYWFEKAANQGNKEAIHNLNEVKKVLNKH